MNRTHGPTRWLGPATIVVVVAATLAFGAGPASAVPPPNVYSASAGGNHDWVPTSGGASVTGAGPVDIRDTMADGNGAAPYVVQSEPGVVRARQVGSFHNPGGVTLRFAPGLTASSQTYLTVTGPGTEVQASLNVHVDGGFQMSCPHSCGVNIGVQVLLANTMVNTVVTLQNGTEVNSLGLTVDAIPGGYHIHGDVQTPVVTLPVGQPIDTTISATAIVGHLGNGLDTFSSWDAWIDHASYATSGAVLNLPDGYSASGESVVDNVWTASTTETASVGGAVVYDLDGDEARDVTDPGLEGVTVFVDADDDGTPDGGEPSTQTDAAGSYALIGLEPGVRTIEYDAGDLPPDFVNTGVKPLVVDLSVGEDMTDQDFFAEHPTPALVADYQLADTYASSVGTPPNLGDVGPGVNAFADATIDGVAERVLTFPAANGLLLTPTTDVIPSDRWTVVMQMRIDPFDFLAKLLDFGSGTPFEGLYAMEQLSWWGNSSCSGNPATPIIPDQWTEVALSRDSAGTIRGYVDGVEQFACDDAVPQDGVIGAANALQFFVGGEGDWHTGGAVDRIRFFEDAMTAEEIAALDAPPPADDVIVTDCDDPSLAALTEVVGDLIIDDPSCAELSLPALTEVGGDLIITASDATSIDLPNLTTVGGDLIITDNPAATVIDVGSLTTVTGSIEVSGNQQATVIDLSSLTTATGDLVITDNGQATVIDVGSLTTATGEVVIADNGQATMIDLSSLTTATGDLVITDNGQATVIDVGSLTTATGEVVITDNGQATVIDMASLTTATGNIEITDNGTAVVATSEDLDVDGDLTLESSGDLTGTTVGLDTDLTTLHGDGSMRVELPDGTFDTPVGFDITRLLPADLAPVEGNDAGGEPATVDPITGYELAFEVPTLGLDATLTFEIDVEALDAATRDALLAALASGTASLVTKGDAPDATYQAFPLCDAEPPAADGCVLLELLDASGLPTTGTPATVRFTGVTGHFSTWAVAVVEPVPPRAFPDVPPPHPFYDDIMWLVGEEITDGFPDGTFRPGMPVSRQGMAAFLYRFANPGTGSSAPCTTAIFTDVPADHPFCPEIAWLVDAGIASGYDDGTFGGARPVSRQAMAAFLFGFVFPAAPKPVCTSAAFPDVPVTNLFCGEIAWLIAEGITEGFPDGTYRGAMAVSRQGMAAFLHRLAPLVD